MFVILTTLLEIGWYVNEACVVSISIAPIILLALFVAPIPRSSWGAFDITKYLFTFSVDSLSIIKLCVSRSSMTGGSMWVSFLSKNAGLLLCAISRRNLFAVSVDKFVGLISNIVVTCIYTYYTLKCDF